jgi:ABC-type Fe3+-hydroxamate transport system substrate-binding protein
MPVFTDQLGHTLNLPSVPRRIISIVPSQSEYLWDLGLRQELVGISKFCIHPEQMFQSVERVGGTKDLNLDRIRKLRPDLIIGNKEENVREQIEVLKRDFPVWMSDVNTFTDAFSMMRSLAKMTGREETATPIIAAAKRSVDRCAGVFNGQSVAYFIWNRPYMFAGKNTFIDHVITHVGLKNAVGSLERYPVLEIEDLHNKRPDYCFLSSEPFPFKEIHANMIADILPESRIELVDGESFSWYGSRLISLCDYISQLKNRISHNQ